MAAHRNRRSTSPREAASPIDIHVGARIRLRRVLLNMSQAVFADHLGVTFQQVQKYESGHNRISASRMFMAAKALGVEPGWFYEGLPSNNNALAPSDPMASPEAIRLVTAIRRHPPEVMEACLTILEMGGNANGASRS